uniref:Uncharacterized protein n=1 Tax=Lepeophtheirus salmonis TaxID=72036 RepID=A0A0K2UEG2_LEPSM
MSFSILFRHCTA